MAERSGRRMPEGYLRKEAMEMQRHDYDGRKAELVL
jgi:hypothetical protein